MTLPTVEALRERFNYDPETGEITYACDIYGEMNPKKGDVAGAFDGRGYRRIKINNKSYRAHRIAWALMTGKWPDDQIDHRDRNHANNRWENLRAATRSQNAANSIRESRSGAKGVHYSAKKKRYLASICVKGRKFSVGTYRTLEDAADAYARAAIHYFGEFSNIETL